jgi:hypothetical protein
MLTWLTFATVTVGLPYLVARKRPGSLWGAVAPAYSAGLIGAAALLIAGTLLHESDGTAVFEGKTPFGPFFRSALLGPLIALLIARTGGTPAQ